MTILDVTARREGISGVSDITVFGRSRALADVTVTLEVTGRTVERVASPDENGRWQATFDDPDEMQWFACGALIEARAQVDDGPWVGWVDTLACPPPGAARHTGGDLTVRADDAPLVRIAVEGAADVRREPATAPPPRSRSRDESSRRRYDRVAESTDARESRPRRRDARDEREDSGRGDPTGRTRAHDPQAYQGDGRRTHEEDWREHDVPTRRESDPRARERGDREDRRERDRDRESESTRHSPMIRKRQEERDEADGPARWLGALVAASVAGLIVAIAAEGVPFFVGLASGLAVATSGWLSGPRSGAAWGRWALLGAGVGAAAVAALLPLTSFVTLGVYILAAGVAAALVGGAAVVRMLSGGDDDES